MCNKDCFRTWKVDLLSVLTVILIQWPTEAQNWRTKSQKAFGEKDSLYVVSKISIHLQTDSQNVCGKPSPGYPGAGRKRNGQTSHCPPEPPGTRSVTATKSSGLNASLHSLKGVPGGRLTSFSR